MTHQISDCFPLKRNVFNYAEDSRESQSENLVDQAAGRLKRGRDEFKSESDSIRNVKKLKKEGKVPVIIRRLEPHVDELQRDNAFFLGHMKLNKYLQDKIKECSCNETKEQMPSVKLKKYQEKEIEEISQKKDQKIGNQFLELYHILESRRAVKKPEGQAVLQLAKAIISKVSDYEEMQIDSGAAPSKEYRDEVDKYFHMLPIDLPSEELDKVALLVQKRAEESVEHGVSQEDRFSEVELAKERLGFLLLAAEHNLADLSKAIDASRFEESLDYLADMACDIFEEAANRINDHRAIHKSAAIQNYDEALFHKMSVEMANILLLESGSVNFGLIEDAVQILVPENLSETAAMDNIRIFLEELKENPLIWEQIAQVKPPESGDIPSDLAIRACLELSPKETITKRHAEIFVLSALLGHLRQAKAGTCFATACLIKAHMCWPNMFIDDLKMLTEKGYTTRLLFKEERKFPFFARVTKEYLDTELEVDKKGRIQACRPYNNSKWPKPKRGVCLSDSPGIRAACRLVGFDNIEEAVKTVLKGMPQKFSVNDFLKELARCAYARQESAPYWLRSRKKHSPDEFLIKAQFAFGAQTNHPLHRGYEQVTTSMVNYFGSQYMMPSWVFWTMWEVLEKADKGYSRAFQTKYKRLIKEMFLPMITRMRYLYNPNFDKLKTLFDDGNRGAQNSNYYGYQLCDTGLPKDFKYSTDLYKVFKEGGYYTKIKIEQNQFNDFAPPHLWKRIAGEDKFRDFLLNVAHETACHIKKSVSSPTERKAWDEVSGKMAEDISKPSFVKKMIFLLLGRDNYQKKQYHKNRFNIATVPWQFSWGGDYNEVLKSYFGFGKSPSKLKKYNGTPKEVLAKCINFIKKQPQEIKDSFEDPRSQFLMTAPVHVFLTRPFEPTFKKAWESEIPTNEYISEYVEKPGLKIANSRLNIRQRKEILSFVEKNKWAARGDEKDDWERQQLTERSKEIFDGQLAGCQELFSMSCLDFKKKLEEIVFLSRAKDPQIGERNRVWEGRFKTALGRCIKQHIPNAEDREKQIPRKIAQEVIDFARNRKDTVALTEPAVKKFLDFMQKVPYGVSLRDFRNAVVKAAYRSRCEYMCCLDPKWKGLFSQNLDTKLFSLLSKEHQEELVASGIVTHDTNWKKNIHNVHFIFLVNPATGKIELAQFFPDTKKVEFMCQQMWFPKKMGWHGYWQFPDNYRVWSNQPLFNLKKHMGLLES